MSITGAKFLKVTKAADLVISHHAMDRLGERLGFPLTKGLAAALFRRSRHLRADEMMLLGYRPAYGRRRTTGEKSWYFLFTVFGQELVAVLTEEDGRYVWVTTYAPNQQSKHLRLAAA